ncbi:MAG: 3-phosphoshikimate 1-carboxyvinyltransferase [Magnetococcus sp. DMHC-6]
MYLKITPNAKPTGKLNVPSSKPETQRAIFIASLAHGVSLVKNDLRCVESETMKVACRHLGAKIIEHPNHLEIHGIGHRFNLQSQIIHAKGSGLVFRIFTALASFINGPVIITGDATLRNRVMSPLFDGLRMLGASVECIADENKAPVVNWGNTLTGSSCTFPGNISSQFITAILLIAPLARNPIEIRVDGTVYSQSYIRQTLEAMRHAGISVEYTQDLTRFYVQPSEYQPVDSFINGDYTSASYLLAWAMLNKGTTILTNMSENSLQGERAIVSIIRALGIDIQFDENKREIIVNNPHDSIFADIEFDAKDSPNIVPTLAAIGSFVQGRFRVVGGSITRFHKAPRIDAMITELTKLGVDITPIFHENVCDGFEIHGAPSYEGGKHLSSWGDHRIFMSLYVVSLKCQKSNFVDGYLDVDCSFPTFFQEFEKDNLENYQMASA